MKRPAYFLLLLPGLAQAAEPLPSAAASISQMMIGLVVILFVLYGALHMLRRLQQGNQSPGTNLKVLSATAVGPRERVVLVAAGKRVLVLGVAAGRVNMLHVMEEGEIPLPEPTKPQPLPDFAGRLKQMMERTRK